MLLIRRDTPSPPQLSPGYPAPEVRLANIRESPPVLHKLTHIGHNNNISSQHQPTVIVIEDEDKDFPDDGNNKSDTSNSGHYSTKLYELLKFEKKECIINDEDVDIEGGNEPEVNSKGRCSVVL